MKRTVISRKDLGALVERGVVAFNKEANCWKVSVPYSKPSEILLASLELLKGMCECYILDKRHDVEVVEDDNPLDTVEGYYVPEWIFVDRQEDLLKLYEKRKKDA